MSDWISIDDRLPEENTWVLCFLPNLHFHGDLILSLKMYNHRWFQEGKIKKIFMFSNIDRSWRIQDITHWMPLPSPPDMPKKL